jgi:hypothetical protein
MEKSKDELELMIRRALRYAVENLYFDDSADYGTALWKIVECLGGEEACDLLEDNGELAYQTYCCYLKEE